jgi:hypothetical protein
MIVNQYSKSVSENFKQDYTTRVVLGGKSSINEDKGAYGYRYCPNCLKRVIGARADTSSGNACTVTMPVWGLVQDGFHFCSDVCEDEYNIKKNCGKIKEAKREAGSNCCNSGDTRIIQCHGKENPGTFVLPKDVRIITGTPSGMKVYFQPILSDLIAKIYQEGGSLFGNNDWDPCEITHEAVAFLEADSILVDDSTHKFEPEDRPPLGWEHGISFKLNLPGDRFQDIDLFFGDWGDTPIKNDINRGIYCVKRAPPSEPALLYDRLCKPLETRKTPINLKTLIERGGPGLYIVLTCRENEQRTITGPPEGEGGRPRFGLQQVGATEEGKHRKFAHVIINI